MDSLSSIELKRPPLKQNKNQNRCFSLFHIVVSVPKLDFSDLVTKLAEIAIYDVNSRHKYRASNDH